MPEERQVCGESVRSAARTYAGGMSGLQKEREVCMKSVRFTEGASGLYEEREVYRKNVRFLWKEHKVCKNVEFVK